MKALRQALKSHSTPEKKASSERFFKTAPGEYGHGDIFLGATVPEVRAITKRFKDLDLKSVEKLLCSKIHEERLCALYLLRIRFESARKENNPKLQASIIRSYLQHRKWVNNWDLVDASAPYLSGVYWFHFLKKPARLRLLKKLASSASLWDRRIAIVSTFYFIRQGEFEETLMLSKQLIDDPEDLIHKAIGWMLREVGKRDEKSLRDFLNAFGSKLPRTALRYSIERMSKKDREFYLRTTRLDSGTSTKNKLPKRSVRPAATSA
jgi:hypothetical protein